MTRVNFTAGNEIVVTEWRDTGTANKLLAGLGLGAPASYWGGELYIPVPVKAPVDPDANDGVVEPDTVAFWGPTPASRGGECRAASAVNVVVGRVTNPEVLGRLKARQVKVASAE